MGLIDTSDEDDIKAGLLTAALSSFPEGVTAADLGIRAICRALVTANAFKDQEVFKVQDIVIEKGNRGGSTKVGQWIESSRGQTRNARWMRKTGRW